MPGVHLSRLLSLAALAVHSGCGDNHGPLDQADPVCDQAAAAACLVNQHACVLEADGPSCVPCELGQYATQSGQCAAIAGTPLHHAFAEFETAAGEEVLGLCQSWTIDNDEQLFVNAVELVQNEGSHHSNWTFVPEDRYEGPDGVWPCDERGYDQLSAALAGGVLYAQSTQAAKEVQKFPDGAVVRIPPRARIIGDVHILNPTDFPISGRAEMTIYALDAADVRVKLAPFHMTYDGLDIPPLSTSRFTGECALSEDFQNTLGTPLEMTLYYALPHTHALGTRFFFEVVGGPDDGRSLIDVSGFNSEARGRLYDPPLDLAGATGLRFGCEFENPRDQSVGWGFGDQEMCEMLGFAEMDMVFESRVEEAVADGTDGATQLFTGPCSTLAIRRVQ
jgi:hypothetical protein